MALQVTNSFVFKEWLIILLFFIPRFHYINPRITLLSYHKTCLISYICEFMRCLLCALRYALWLLQCVDIFIRKFFHGNPLSLMCTKVNACMYLYIFGHSQWIRACMRSNKTLWYCCKRHGDCNFESLWHTHRCLKTTKETASEKKQIDKLVGHVELQVIICHSFNLVNTKSNVFVCKFVVVIF